MPGRQRAPLWELPVAVVPLDSLLEGCSEELLGGKEGEGIACWYLQAVVVVLPGAARLGEVYGEGFHPKWPCGVCQGCLGAEEASGGVFCRLVPSYALSGLNPVAC